VKHSTGYADDKNGEIHFWLDRAKFFEIGRVLQKNWHSSDLGHVTISVQAGKLTIMTKRGGGEISCEGAGEISARLYAPAFRNLIASRGHEKSPSGKMKFTFRPQFGEVAIDIAGVKARFEKKV
jgi:hypothetical protein